MLKKSWISKYKFELASIFCYHNKQPLGAKFCFAKIDCDLCIFAYLRLRDRLMVGHGTLDPSIMVRIHVPQLYCLLRTDCF